VLGLTVAILAYALGDLSGAHLNPAVTLGFFLARRLPPHRVASFLTGQVIGALLAVALLRLLLPELATPAVLLAPRFSASSFGLEAALTLVLMLVALSVSEGARLRGAKAGVAIGAVVALAALLAGPVSGGSLNPVRSLPLALLAGRPDVLWLCWAAPLLGAGLAVGVCCRARSAPCCRALPKEAWPQWQQHPS
jgi:aquaporin Z